MTRPTLSSVPPSKGPLRAAKRLTLVPVGLMAAMSAVLLSGLAVGWQTVTATVTRIDAPRSCRSDRSLLSGPRHRDWAPHASAACCGLVQTDHGTVRLPESNRLAFGPWTREALLDRLREGFVVRLRVHGWGFDLAPGAPRMGQEQGTKTLWRIEPAGPCPLEATS